MTTFGAYNRKLEHRLVDHYYEMIQNTSQPEMGCGGGYAAHNNEPMWGGKRVRQFVLAGSTPYDYPSSLAVGELDGHYAPTVLGNFKGDDNKEMAAQDLHAAPAPQHMGENALEGGSLGSFFRKVGRAFKPVGNALKPVGNVLKGVATDVAKDLVTKGVEAAPGLALQAATAGAGRKPRSRKPKDISVMDNMEGGFSFKSLGRSIKKGVSNAAKAAAPIAKQVSNTVKHEGSKLANEAKKGAKSVGKDILENVIKPGAQDIHENVLKPAARDLAAKAKDLAQQGVAQAKSGLQDALKQPSAAGAGRKPRKSRAKGGALDGGVLLENKPAEFHNGSYPPALQSYLPIPQDTGSKGGAMVANNVRRVPGIPPKPAAEEGGSLVRGKKRLLRNLPKLVPISTTQAAEATVPLSQSPAPAKSQESSSGSQGGARKKRAPSARNLAISKAMKEHGLSLGEASKWVKAHGC